ncbi:MAG TPA: hypothetical protein VNM36_05430, partial [Gemmatimonadaceae bacterium]|nr:hypothetical protein [Gemmatimonadaceae bacterium]
MRRSALTVFAVTAVLAIAACAPDSADRGPLVPTEPSLALSDQCAGGLASDIAKQQKALFSDPDLTDLQTQFAAIKSACPTVPTTQLLTYVESMIGYSGAPTNAARAQGLVNLLG